MMDAILKQSSFEPIANIRHISVTCINLTYAKSPIDLRLRIKKNIISGSMLPCVVEGFSEQLFLYQYFSFWRTKT